MTDDKRETLIQNTGTKESPFFDTNFGETDILTNIVIPVVFIVIGKFQMIRAVRHHWTGYFLARCQQSDSILNSAILGTLGNSATVLLLTIKGLKKTTDILVYNLGTKQKSLSILLIQDHNYSSKVDYGLVRR